MQDFLIMCTQGRQISALPWFNLSAQELQPLFQECIVVRAVLRLSEEGAVEVQLAWMAAAVVEAPAYQGGNILKIEGALKSPACLPPPSRFGRFQIWARGLKLSYSGAGQRPVCTSGEEEFRAFLTRSCYGEYA